jgi:small subunit ribosomal protein S20
MPIKHAAMRQMRKDRVRQLRNQAVRAELRTLSKRLVTLLNDRKATEAGQLMPAVAKAYDRAASKRVIHPRAAARYKSRFALRLKKLAK